MAPLRFGARASLMSLKQSTSILAALAPTSTTLHPFHGEGGDRSADRATLESDGVFSDQIESALLAGHIDVAIHCLKDVRTHDTPGLCLSAYLPRDDTRDCLVTRHRGATLDTLPAGATIATASVRRAAAVRAHRPDLTVTPLRGPVHERLRLLDDPAGPDALIVATCSMERLGLAERIAERIHHNVICPPLGAAIIALQTRTDDTSTREQIAHLNHPATATEADTERLLLASLGGYCNAPLAGTCTTRPTPHGPLYTVRACRFTPDGTSLADFRRTGTDPLATARTVARKMADA
ncbi:hydroxymethylbilane synthase [Streptomyces sp. NPDC127106]|uniref:hydroxymethylbilane synthase n=1 Tax=Streptomyces sp. NPDC127106 TaxID=3345360 RepID=UPI003633AC14